MNEVLMANELKDINFIHVHLTKLQAIRYV